LNRNDLLKNLLVLTQDVRFSRCNRYQSVDDDDDADSAVFRSARRSNPSGRDCLQFSVSKKLRTRRVAKREVQSGQ